MGRTSDRRYPVVETAPPPFLPEGSAGILAEPLALDAEGLEALHSLCTALTSLRGHPGLLLALYDSPLLRDRLIAETAARLDGRLQVLDAREAPPDLLPWLVSVASPETDALFVVNLQNISVAAQYLNYRREILTQLPCPVVFWLPYDKEEELHRLAPDFWAFRRQTFVFRLFAPWVLRVSQKVAETGARAETPESRRASISLYRQLLSDLEHTGAGKTLLAARLRRQLGDLLRREGLWNKSRSELEQALAILETSAEGDTWERAEALHSFGLTLYYLDELDRAVASYAAALELFRAVGDRLGEANVQQALGDLALREDRLGEARKHYEAALAIYQDIGDRLGEANTLAALSRLALQQGRDEEARALLQQAVDLHAAIGSRYDVAADLGNFGLVLRDLGRLEEARPYLLQAAEMFEVIGLHDRAERHRQAAQGVPLHPAVARMAPLLLALVAVAAGEIRGEAARPVREALAAMAQTQDWAALAGALQRVLDGEREWEALAQGLDEIDQQALALVLAALQDPPARQLLRALAEGAVHEHE